MAIVRGGGNPSNARAGPARTRFQIRARLAIHRLRVAVNKVLESAMLDETSPCIDIIEWFNSFNVVLSLNWKYVH